MAWKQVGLRDNGEYISNHRFTDGVALLCNSGDEVQSMISALDKRSRIVRLKINMRKTKVMLDSFGKVQRFEIGDKTVEVVSLYIK